MDLKGRRAAVTGAGQGIGRAIALRLAELGAAVAVIDINGDGAAAVAEEISSAGGEARDYRLDVGDAGAASEVLRRVTEDLGGLDILVNNAGITRDNLLLRMTPEEWDAVLSVNLTGAFNCIRAVVRTMMTQRFGRIINVSSIIGQVGNAGQDLQRPPRGRQLGDVVQALRPRVCASTQVYHRGNGGAHRELVDPREFRPGRTLGVRRAARSV